MSGRLSNHGLFCMQFWPFLDKLRSSNFFWVSFFDCWVPAQFTNVETRESILQLFHFTRVSEFNDDISSSFEDSVYAVEILEQLSDVFLSEIFQKELITIFDDD